MSIQLDFEKGVVKQDVGTILDKLLEGAEQALNEVADLMVGLWQVGARVDTGAYRDSVRKERGGQGMHWREVKVRAGGYVINPETKKLVDYAVALEERYHTGRIAWEQVKPQVEDIIRRYCDAQLRTLDGVTVG